ncbi:MAG TPA: GDP-mannose 4,6-dehydratase, partial [Acidimicrobiales bacterium]|nr:GDP-mannose 4,6-dehydratase [Acidimicrobiales bacterium]
WGDPGGTFAVNVVGTVHLLDSLSRCRPVPRVLLISSAEVYGAVRPGELPLTEEQPFAPVSPYAASKAAAEMAGIQAWLGRGVEVVRARPFSHIGAGQRPDFVVPSMARQLVEASRTGSRTLMVGNLGARRDFTDVRDVVRAYRLLLEHGEAGAVYNVCSGVSRPISEIVDRLLALSGLDVEVRVDPARFRPSDLPDLRGDPSRLTARTGWLPEVDLDRTLADVLADCTAGDAVSD